MKANRYFWTWGGALVATVAALAFAVGGCAGLPADDPAYQAAQAELRSAMDHVAAAAAHAETIAGEVMETKEEVEAKWDQVAATLAEIRTQGLTGEAFTRAMETVAALQAEASVLQGRYEHVRGELDAARGELAAANVDREQAAEHVEEVAGRTDTPEWLLWLGLAINAGASLVLRGLPSKGIGSVLTAALTRFVGQSEEHRRRRVVTLPAPPTAATT